MSFPATRQVGGRFTVDEVRDVLTQLSASSDRRILRRTFPPERFEIFHDVLAKPIVEWVEARRSAAAASRWRRIAASLAAAAIVLIGLSGAAVYFGSQARTAQAEAEAAQARAQEAAREIEQARNESLRLSHEVQRAADLRAEALAALEAGNKLAAEKLAAAAEQVEKAAAQRQVMTPSEIAEIASLRKNVADLIAQRDRDRGQIESLQKEIAEKDRQLAARGAERDTSKIDPKVQQQQQQRPPTEQLATPTSGVQEPPSLQRPGAGSSSQGSSSAPSPASSSLLLRLTDQYGRLLNDRVNLRLRHTRIQDTRSATGLDGRQPIRIAGLSTGIYVFEVRSARYRSVDSEVVIGKGDSIKAIALDLDFDKEITATFPGYAQLPDQLRRVLERSTVEDVQGFGEPLYNSLTDIQRAGLLNLFTKMQHTVVTPGPRSVWSFVDRVFRVRGDRIFVDVDSSLLNAVDDAIAARHFAAVATRLDSIPAGFDGGSSYKSVDRAGSLQLTVFTTATTPRSTVVEADIDEGRGVRQALRIIGKTVSGSSAHPYAIHQILWYHQKLDTLYRLQ